MSVTRDALHEVFRDAGAGSALSLREVLARLKAPREAARAARGMLRELAREGSVRPIGRGRFQYVPEARLARGQLAVARGGYGFVRLEEPEPGGAPDVFIPRPYLAGALHGDRVAVRITGSRDGRLDGTVAAIIERAHATVLGVWEAASGARARHGLVRPLDTRVALLVRARHDIPIETGTVVEVSVDRFPEDGGLADGKVSHVIGPVDDPRFDVAIVCRKYGLTEVFPDDARAQAEAAPQSVTEREIAGRSDFRQDLVYTIDPETAKDFDDAICVTREGDGYLLAVHIADVSHYVPEGSALDVEALRRGTSVYFPGFVVPMLPHALSSGICSLKPHEERLVLSALLRIDGQGALRHATFTRGVIKSIARFTYPEAQRILDGDRETCERYPALCDPLLLAEELARLLRRRRKARGSIDFDLPEAEIVWDLEGQMSGVVPADTSFTHKLIEEFMLLANEAVATRLHGSRRSTIYRIHERPDPKKLEALSEELRVFGLRLEGDFEEPTPQMFQRLLDSVKGKPWERIVSSLALRAMMLARYDTQSLGHFGLAAPLYTHFTSPIRRYPDLAVHRLLCEAESGAILRARDAAGISAQSSLRERIAQDAEREVLGVKKARFMYERMGEEFDGIILSVDKQGAWAELEEYLIDGFISAGSLQDDVYELDERGRCLRGALRGRSLKLGDRVRVRVDRVDMERRFIDFAVVWPDATADKQRPSRQALRRARRLLRRERAARPARAGKGGRPNPPRQAAPEKRGSSPKHRRGRRR